MIGVLTTFSNYIDRTVAAVGDSTEDRLRKRTFTLILFFKSLCCAPWALMYAALGLSVAAFLPLSYAGIMLVGIVVFFITKNMAVFVRASSFFMLLVPVLLQLQLGGFAPSGAVMIWCILAPLSVLIFRGILEARIWFAGFVLTMLAACVAEQVLPPVVDRPTWVISLFFAMNVGAVGTIVFGALQYFIEQARKEQETVAQQNVALEATLSQLKEMQHQLILKEKMATLGNLAAGIAHEINTPIGAVRSAVDVCTRCLGNVVEMVSGHASQEMVVDPRYQKSLELMQLNSKVITEATERVATIVNNLKDFARLDEAEVQTADLHAGLDTTLTLLQHELGDSIGVTKEYGQIPSIRCSPNQLNQVFMSLLSTAIGSIDGAGTVTIRTYVEGDAVNVVIGDDGRGIPAEQLEGLFDLSFGTSDSRISMNTSLPNAFNIVRSHDGDLTVESQAGQGTVFTIHLPVSGLGGTRVADEGSV